MPRNIVITGASSGLGRALALEYAAAGVTLALIGRDRGRLEDVAARAVAKGAAVDVGVCDVRDREAMRAFLLAFDDRTPTDCIIASAGVTMVTPAPGAVEDLTLSQGVFEVNWNGAMNTIAPLAPRMRARRSGAIVVFSSLAAFARTPDAPTYAASKAALATFALATRALYRADGVSVSAVCPGFVDTPMTSSYAAAKPFLVGPETAAKTIRRGLERKRAIIAFPRRLYWAVRLLQLLPEPLQARIMLLNRATATSGSRS